MQISSLAIAVFALATSSASEPTMVMKCKANHNYKTVTERSFDVASNSVANVVGQFEEFKVLLNQRNQTSELEIYNLSEESRSYAKSSLKSVGDKVELARWTRDHVFEVICERIK